MKQTSEMTLRRLIVRALLLTIVIPAVVLLFLFRNDLANLDANKLIVLGLVLLLALVGFYLILIVLRSIGSIQKDLKRMAKGETESIDVSQDVAQLLEMTEIINTLNEIKAGSHDDDPSRAGLSGSGSAKDALKLAKAESRRRGKKVVTSTDLLLALLKVQEGPVADMIKESGLTYENAAHEVEKLDEQSGPEEREEVEDLSEGLEIIDDEQLDEFMHLWPNLNEETRSKIMKFVRSSTN